MYASNYNESQKLNIQLYRFYALDQYCFSIQCNMNTQKETCTHLPACKISKSFSMRGLIKLSCNFHFAPHQFTEILTLGECDIHEDRIL
jgi:hypothetical protein